MYGCGLEKGEAVLWYETGRFYMVVEKGDCRIEIDDRTMQMIFEQWVQDRLVAFAEHPDMLAMMGFKETQKDNDDGD